MGITSPAGQSGDDHVIAGDVRAGRSDAAAIRNAMIEANAARRGGMLCTGGSGGGATWRADDGLDELVGGAGIEPTERPSLDELVERFGLLPFDQAVTTLNTEPHRYSWYGFEIEKGARTTTFTLSHGEPADYWMFLVDPSGTEIHPSDARVIAWNAGAVPYECAKIDRPAAGQWLVIGVRLDRGPAVPSRAIASIDHREVTVHGEVLSHGAGRPVEFRAGAGFIEPLTDLSVTARVKRCDGPWHELRLRDDLHAGVYRGCADIPAGAYTGYIEIRAPERPPFANAHLPRLATTTHDGVDAGRAETAGFLRHLPVSVVVDAAEHSADRRAADPGSPADDGRRPPFDARRWSGSLLDLGGLGTRPPAPMLAFG